MFPDQDDFGRVFRNNAVMSARGIPQMTAIMGMCVAGGAYLPVMTDHVLMTEGSGLFLAGPALVQAAIGQKVSAEELGGATMHAEISGTVDFKEPNDHLCLARLRSLGSRDGPSCGRAVRSGRLRRCARMLRSIAAEDLLRHRQSRSRGRVAKLRYARSDCAHCRPVRALTSTSPTMARRCFAATRASAASPSALSPTRKLHRTQISHTRRKAYGVWRRHLSRFRQRAVTTLHHGLQSEPDPADFSARRERIYGGTRRKMNGIIRSGAEMVSLFRIVWCRKSP